MSGPGWAALVAMLAVFVYVALAARASRRLLVVDVRDGEIVGARGRAPGELLHDFQDALRSGSANGTIAIVVERGSASMEARGDFDEGTKQRLRNVLGRFSLPRLRGAPKAR